MFHFLIVLGFVLFACNERALKQTPNGLKFRVVKEGDGLFPKNGDVVLYNYRLVDSNDSVWRDSYFRGIPLMESVRDSSSIPYEKKLKQMMRMVSRGDSIVVDFDLASYYKDVEGRPVPNHSDPTLTLSYYIKIDSIMTLDAYRPWIADILKKRWDARLKEDGDSIDLFLSKGGIVPLKSKDGIRYIMIKKGSSVKSRTKQIVLVNYHGYFLNGKSFVSNVKSIATQSGIYDPNLEYEPLEVIIDQSSVIAGWHAALKLVGKGDRGIFYLPSTLAYGEQGLGNVVPPNSILVFDIEVLNLRDAKSHELDSMNLLPKKGMRLPRKKD